MQADIRLLFINGNVILHTQYVQLYKCLQTDLEFSLPSHLLCDD